jgi:hypothetical protein
MKKEVAERKRDTGRDSERGIHKSVTYSLDVEPSGRSEKYGKGHHRRPVSESPSARDSVESIGGTHEEDAC